MSPLHTPSRLVPGAALMLAFVTSVEAQPLRTGLGSYFIFAMRSANVKDLDVLSPCNVAVNCARPSSNSSCGTSTLGSSLLSDGSQLAADVARFNKDGASVSQLFANMVPNPSNVQARKPGPGPAGANALALPILGDLDGDGTPSCGRGCTPDFGDLAAFCKLPAPFPACDTTNAIVVSTNEDCNGAPDAQPGNARCDLPPGRYGELTVQNGAIINFEGGTYDFCDVQMGKNVHSVAARATTLNVRGDINVNNGSAFGEECGDFTVNAAGPGEVSFGRNMSVTGFFCAPERHLGLGHDNDLTGRFVADTVTADLKNRGRCCGGLCACIDEFAPATAGVGDTIALTGGCSLTNVTEVRICAIPATITSQSDDKIEVTVPLGAAGACLVEVDSDAGTFIHADKLTVG
jgi:hypothetical protein